MNRVNMYFKMVICSLILVSYRGFSLLGIGLESFYELFFQLAGKLNINREVVDPYFQKISSINLTVLLLIAILGNILLFYSITKFFIECFKLNKNKLE